MYHLVSFSRLTDVECNKHAAMIVDLVETVSLFGRLCFEVECHKKRKYDYHRYAISFGNIGFVIYDNDDWSAGFSKAITKFNLTFDYIFSGDPICSLFVLEGETEVDISLNDVSKYKLDRRAVRRFLKMDLFTYIV